MALRVGLNVRCSVANGEWRQGTFMDYTACYSDKNPPGQVDRTGPNLGRGPSRQRPERLEGRDFHFVPAVRDAVTFAKPRQDAPKAGGGRLNDPGHGHSPINQLNGNLPLNALG